MPITQLKRGSHRTASTLPLTFDRFDYKKTPISASGLYVALRAQVRRNFPEQVVFAPPSFISERLLAVSEFPFVFSFATALRLMIKQNNRNVVTIHYNETDDEVQLSLVLEGKHVRAVHTLLDKYGDALFEIASPSHFRATIKADRTSISYHMAAPLFAPDAFEVYARKTALSDLIAFAFESALSYTA